MSGARFSWQLGCLLALTAAASLPVHARQSPGSITRTVQTFLQQQQKTLPGHAEWQITPVDPRLQLADCRQMQAALPAGARLWGHTGIEVRCTAPAWRVTVPVVVHVRAPAVILAHAVAAGQVLTNQDLGQQETDLTELGPDVLLSPADAIGRVMATPAPAGFPLRTQLLRQPYVITSGQPVRVLVQGDGFSLETQATAMGNASTGQRVMLRTRAGKVLSGVAQAPGVVRVSD